MIIFALFGICFVYFLITLFFKNSEFLLWYRIFFLIMGVIALVVTTQGIYVVYDNSVSGNESIACNLTVGCHIVVPNLTVDNIFGGSDFNIWDDYNMNWNTIHDTNLNNTVIDNSTTINGTGYPNPDFDSGWIAFNKGDKKLITHSVGGNESNYHVIVYARSAAHLINQINYGSRHLSYGVAGYRWEALNSTHIQVWRFVEDVSAEELRVLIWEYDYSSSGTEIITLETNADDTDEFPRNAIYDNLTLGNSVGNWSVDETGSLTLLGNASKQEDLRFPSIYIKGIGINIPDFTTFLNSTYVWLFDEKKNEELFILGQTPHRRANGTDMDAHFHWSPLTADAGDVVWCIEYTWANIDSVFVNSTTQCILDPSDEIQYQHQMTTMIDMGGSGKNLSSAISARLYRDADNASDDYAFDAALLEFDFHYDVGSFGSDTI